jgi:hypothetical protein
MEHQFKSMQNDNYALREYVLTLQNRLMDAQVEIPPPPANLQIPLPHPATRPASHATASHVNNTAPEPAPAPPSTVGAPSAGSLADVAAAVAGLRAHGGAVDSYSKFKPENESPRREEDSRRLHESLPPSSSLRA